MSGDFFDFPEGCTPRRGRLMASGIVLAILGFLNLMSVGVSVFYMIMMGTLMATMPADEMKEFEQMKGFLIKGQVANIVVFGAASVAFIWVGFGSIFLKRWSRPLALIISWGWLYIGIMTIVTLLVLSGGIRRLAMESMAGSPPGGPNPMMAINLVLAIYIAMFFIFGVMLPGLLVWLNWHRDVRVTLEFCDRKPRWTDRCPVPVLGLAVTLALGALYCLPAMLFQWFPVFGKVLTGAEAVAGIGGLMLLMLAIAWACYRRSLLGWGGALVLLLAGGVSGYVSMLDFDLAGLFGQMGLPEKEMDDMRKDIEPFQRWLVDGHVLTTFTVVSFLPPIAYLVWVLRYFFPAKESAGLKEAC